MRTLVTLLAACAGAAWLVLIAVGTSGAQGMSIYLPGFDDSLPGAALYQFHCSTCHGPTGLGLEESRQRFPADHQQCIRCHNPRNPAILPEHHSPTDLAVFSLGDPTPLADASYLAKFPNLAVLETYVRFNMPRWNPGRLSQEEAREVTLYALHLSGSLTGPVGQAFYEGGDLTALEAAAVTFGP